MQSLEHTTKTVGQGQRLPMNSLWPSTARTRARKCRMSVETARLRIPCVCSDTYIPTFITLSSENKKRRAARSVTILTIITL